MTSVKGIPSEKMYVPVNSPITRPPSRRAAPPDSPPPPSLLSRPHSAREPSVQGTNAKLPAPSLTTAVPPLPRQRPSSRSRKSSTSSDETTPRSSRPLVTSSLSRARIKTGGSSSPIARRQSSRKTKSKTRNNRTSSSSPESSTGGRRPSSRRRASTGTSGALSSAPESSQRRSTKSSQSPLMMLPPESPRVERRVSSSRGRTAAPASPASDSTPKRHNSAARLEKESPCLPPEYAVTMDGGSGVPSLGASSTSRSPKIGRKSLSQKSSSSSSHGGAATPPVTPTAIVMKPMVRRVSAPVDLEALRRASLRGGATPKSPPQIMESLPSYNARRKNARSIMSGALLPSMQDKALVSSSDEQQPISEEDQTVSSVYKHARKHEWDEMMTTCRLHPDEAAYVNPADGTTALHVAVMSRTGYSPPVSQQEQQDGQKGNDSAADDNDEAVAEDAKEPHPAPLDVIEELLQLYPDASKVVCKLYSYTPLAYACLVSGEKWNLEDSAAMVRVFLKNAPDCLSIFTEGGLSALDVHIISFSYKNREQQVEDNILSGRTSTVVLRTLLEADPCLAHVRIRKDKVGGPIELLYRCNSGAFLDAVDLDDKSYMKKKSDQNGKSVIATITNWWVWKWTILLLKYGTVPYKKKGAPFLAVQAAAAMVGCPLPVLTLALKAFPKQIRQRDVMQGIKGNLPLHEVATWPCQQDSESTEPVISSRKGMAISALLQEYPEGAKITNNLNQTPLELAVASGTTWDGGVRKLVRSNPDAVAHKSRISRLVPFLAAAAAATAPTPGPKEPPKQQLPQQQLSSRRSLAMQQRAVAKRDVQSIRTIYGLLRADPMVLTQLTSFDYNRQQQEKKDDDEKEKEQL